MKKTILFFTLALAVTACQKTSRSENEQFKKAQWLIGNWENKSEFGTLAESWQKLNDSTLIGQSYFINATKDTVHTEKMRVYHNGDNLVYEATVKGQNNDKPVLFKLSLEEGKSFIFENPTHDYPQKITYTQKDASHLVAKISGKQQGKVSQEQFELTKK